MKISKLIYAITIGSMITMTACRDTKTNSGDDHGHQHNPDGSHMDDEPIEQEEFQVGKDSMETNSEEHGHDHGTDGNNSNDDTSKTHTHDDGSEQHDH